LKPSKDAWDVFEEHHGGTHFSGDSEELGPDIPFVAVSLLFSGDGKRLARQSRCDEIHRPSERLAVEVLHVAAPNRCWLHGLLLHPRQEYGCRIGFPLDVTQNPAFGKDATDSQVEPSDPATQREDGSSHTLFS
jgi:hypothetical protein